MTARHPRWAEVERRVYEAACQLELAVQSGLPKALSDATAEFEAAREEQAACARWIPPGGTLLAVRLDLAADGLVTAVSS